MTISHKLLDIGQFVIVYRGMEKLYKKLSKDLIKIKGLTEHLKSGAQDDKIDVCLEIYLKSKFDIDDKNILAELKVHILKQRYA